MSRLENGQDARALQIAGPDPFEMRADAAQLGVHKAVHKMKTAIQPGEKLVFDFVMDRERNLSAVRPDLGEINDAHETDISAC